MELKEFENAVVISEFFPLRSFAEQKSFLNQVDSLIGKGKINLIFDLKEASFFNTLELGALVSSLKKAKDKGGSLKLIQVGEQINNLLDLTGLKKVFEIHTSEEEALNNLDEGS